MTHFERALAPILVGELKKQQPVFQVMTGPRQVGKTTIAHQVMDKLPFASIYASADSPLPPGPEWIDTQWRRAEVETDRSGNPVLLVLDEVQKVRGWSESLKSRWDAAIRQARDIRLLVLGSSALMIQAGLSESLAGRFFLHRCGHWTFSECEDAFGWDLPRWLFFGGYPGAAVFSDDEEKWKRYVTDSLIETVLARDVLQLQKITKPTLMRHLFALAATFPAQILSYNKMLGQLQDVGNTTTLANYLRLLETAFLVSGLELFSRGSVRKRGSSPKLLLWNNALVNSLSTRSFEESVADASWWGRFGRKCGGRTSSRQSVHRGPQHHLLAGRRQRGGFRDRPREPALGCRGEKRQRRQNIRAGVVSLPVSRGAVTGGGRRRHSHRGVFRHGSLFMAELGSGGHR
jgi:uncharacterized protein